MAYRMPVYLVVLGLLAFPLNGNSELEAAPDFFPVAATTYIPKKGKLYCYLLGGWHKGAWVHDRDAARLLRGGETYRFYNLDGELWEGEGSKPKLLGEEGVGPCGDVRAIRFDDPPIIEGGFVAVGGRVEALPRLPRLPKLQETEKKVYQKATAAILRGKGIARPDVRVTQVIRVDLDGDGVEEVLVSATHYAKDSETEVSPGDYSLVYLRRVIDDRVVTRIIVGDCFPRGDELGSAGGVPTYHRVGAVLDLNGDGVMEIVLFGGYNQGNWITVYGVDRVKIMKILTAWCGA